MRVVRVEEEEEEEEVQEEGEEEEEGTGKLPLVGLFCSTSHSLWLISADFLGVMGYP